MQAQSKVQPVRPYTADEAKEARKTAELYFKDMNYPEALRIYERLVVTSPENAEYNHKLGLSYLNTNLAKHKAVSYLEFAANANTKDKPKNITFDLARAYHYAGLYDKALQTYEQFRVEQKGSVDAKLKFEQHVQWSENAKTLTQNAVQANFENIGKGINSNFAEYRPVMGISDTVIYFTSYRKGATGGLTDEFGDTPSDIFFFTQNDTSRSKAKNAGVNINTMYYEEALFLNAAGDRMLVYMEGPESGGDIHISQLQGKQWTKPVVIGKDFQTKVLETGASLSPDGLTLYFAAEELDSKTGKDIYKCVRTESSSWGRPERLSDVINTSGDEDNPFLWVDGKTLFFSSTGHNSMGGFDVFRAVMTDPREGFGKPENIGYPLNSVYDDMGIAVTADGKTVYTGAVRDSGLGDYDIYKVTLSQPVVTSPVCWLQGRAFTNVGAAAKGAYLVISDEKTGETIASLETNEATGRFDVALPEGNYKVVLRHAKHGKVETMVKVDSAAAGKVVVELKFP